MTLPGIVRNCRWLLFSLLMAGAMAHGQSVPDDCSQQHHIDWPAGHPVWSLCWISPDSSSGIDGSGLELRDVFFKGRRVRGRRQLGFLGSCNGSPRRQWPLSFCWSDIAADWKMVALNLWR